MIWKKHDPISILSIAQNILKQIFGNGSQPIKNDSVVSIKSRGVGFAGFYFCVAELSIIFSGSTQHCARIGNEICRSRIILNPKYISFLRNLNGEVIIIVSLKSITLNLY